MASEWERIRQLAGAADRLADRIAGFAPAWLDADEERALRGAGRRVERAAAELAELVDPARHAERHGRRAERAADAVAAVGGDWVTAESEALEDPEACAIAWCERRAVARGLCDAHRQRARQGDLREDEPIAGRRPGAVCGEPGCARPHKARGFCGAHYAAAKRAGRL